MIPFGIVLFLSGAVLAQRFKIFILVPSLLAVWIATVAVGLLIQHPVKLIAGEMAILAAALQLGFLFGVMIRYTMAACRRSRPGILPRRGLVRDSAN
jgi:hypothetical protein